MILSKLTTLLPLAEVIDDSGEGEHNWIKLLPLFILVGLSALSSLFRDRQKKKNAGKDASKSTGSEQGPPAGSPQSPRRDDGISTEGVRLRPGGAKVAEKAAVKNLQELVPRPAEWSPAVRMPSAVSKRVVVRQASGKSVVPIGSSVGPRQLDLPLDTQKDLVRAIVYSEIMGKPLGLR